MAEELCKSCQPLEMKLRREPNDEPQSPEKLNDEATEPSYDPGIFTMSHPT